LNKERSTTFDAGNPHRVSFQIAARGNLENYDNCGFLIKRPPSQPAQLDKNEPEMLSLRPYQLPDRA
jgi:hypothetical protein